MSVAPYDGLEAGTQKVAQSAFFAQHFIPRCMLLSRKADSGSRSGSQLPRQRLSNTPISINLDLCELLKRAEPV